MRDNELIFFHAFSSIGGFGPQKFSKLLSCFGTLERAWGASEKELADSDIGPAAVNSLLKKRNELDPEKLFSRLKEEDIGLITQNHEAYPPQLKEISSAPAVLYARGNLEILKNKSLAVVGSRKFTEYGKRATQGLCRDLVRAGLAIVSGLALGIDAIAHRATLDAGGATIAVLGTGIDDPTIYPRDNFNLAQDILSGCGVLLSEFPPETPSLKQNFPARNRIMAGLSLGTLVVEATLESGSLITAGLALEANREVFAVPGPIFSLQSAGANFLIKNGAKLVESASDILQELNLSQVGKSSSQKIFEPKGREEKMVWNVLSSDPLHVDRIAKLTKLNPAVVGSTLAMMEIQEAVRNVGGQNYVRC